MKNSQKARFLQGYLPKRLENYTPQLMYSTFLLNEQSNHIFFYVTQQTFVGLEDQDISSRRPQDMS